MPEAIAPIVLILFVLGAMLYYILWYAEQQSIDIGPITIHWGAIFSPLVWLLQQMYRQILTHIIGPVADTLVDTMINDFNAGWTVVQVTGDLLYWVDQYAGQKIKDDWRAFSSYVYSMDIPQDINGIYDDIAAHLLQLQYLESAVATINTNVGNLFNDAAAVPGLIATGIADALSPIEQSISSLDGRIHTAEIAIADMLINKIPGLSTAIQTADTNIASLISEATGFTSDITNIKSLLQGVSGVEGTIQNTLNGIQGRVGTLENEFVKVAPLVGLAALTIAELLTLEQLSADPCMCLDAGGGFDWMPGTVAALAAGILP